MFAGFETGRPVCRALEICFTFGRRMRGVRGPQMLTALFRMAFFPKMLTRRSRVEKIWYDSNRGDEDTIADSLTAQVFPLGQPAGQDQIWGRNIQLPRGIGCLAVRIFSFAQPVSTKTDG